MLSSLNDLFANQLGNTINDKEQPTPRVNIIHSNLKYGTVSNKKGNFSLPLDEVQIGDTMIFSRLNYAAIELTANEENF